MTLDDLRRQHNALLAARYSGTRSVTYDGRKIEYHSDSELAAAIADIERRIARMEQDSGSSRRSSRVMRPYAVKDL